MAYASREDVVLMLARIAAVVLVVGVMVAAAVARGASGPGTADVVDLSWLGEDGWALLGVPCGEGFCARLARTADGGLTWTALPTPPAGLTGAGCARLPCVEHVAFASTRVGYLFYPSLLVTRDGGATWSRVAGPQVESLAPGPDDVVRVAYNHEGCPGPCDRVIEAASAGSSRWRVLLAGLSTIAVSRADSAQVLRAGADAIYVPIYGDLAAGVGTQQTTIYRSLDGGRHWSRLGDPCGGSGARARAAIEVAVSPRGSLAALCSPRSAQGADVSVVTSADGGHSWSANRPVPSAAGFAPDLIASAGRNDLVVSNSLVSGSGPYTYRLLSTTDGGQRWSTVASESVQLDTGAASTGYLSFQTPLDGRWVGDQHAIWTTTDGGRRWTRRALAVG